MLDNTVLADQVSRLLKTKYSGIPSKELPFDLAFTEVMNLHSVIGEARYAIKQAIGSILSKRRGAKTTRKILPSNSRTTTQPKINFGIVEQTRARVILKCAMMGDEITYVRDSAGKAIISSYSGNPPRIAISQGLERADALFAEMDAEAIIASEVRLIVQTDVSLHIRLGGKYDAHLTPGGRGSVGTLVLCDGKQIRQSDVPGQLLEEAKAIAKQYFRGVGTLPLPGM